MRLSRYSIIGIMVALLLSAMAIMPVFGAATGTVVVSKTYVSPTGQATITVDDADLNTLTAATQAVDVAFGALGTQAITLALSTSAGDNISGTPTIGTPTAGGQVASNYSLSVFNAATGAITIQAFAASTGNAEFVVSYNLAKVGTVSADVTSPSDTTGISVTLTETGADTGVFEGIFTIDGTASDDAADEILAVPGQAVTVKYSDADPVGTRSTSLSVEDTDPAGTLVSPADDSNTTSLTQALSVNFTDSDSLIDAGSIAIAIKSATNNADADLTGTIKLGTITTTAITNGFKGEVALASVPDDQTIILTWVATASDNAGNTGESDTFTVFIDNVGPDFANATASAGAWWDASDSSVETDVTKSINTSIGIQLPDILGNGKDDDLNAETVTAADFEIDSLKNTAGVTSDDVTPTAANVYAGATNWIFLTVPAMAPDAAPSVTLLSTSGGISDTAGNATTTGTVASSDKQAPTATATLNRSLDDSDATLTVTTNEAGGVPVVTVTNVAAEAAGAPIAQSVSLTGTNIYESKITPGEGVHSIKAVVSDANGNKVTLGTDTPTTDFPKSTSIALYIDSNLPVPDVTVNTVSAAGASVETSDPFFIKAVFTDEGAEYGLTGAGVVTATAATVTTDLDVHNTVTIATVTLDDVSQLALVDTQDNITFNVAINGITTGDHELVIVGEDAAGNTATTGTIEFTVTARKAYKVAVSAGWNLVSFPGDPTDSAIGSVLPATHPATDVLSFDDGVWSVASRTAGGTWEGTLTTIDGKHGYWVNTSSSEPVEALLTLASVGSAATLPTIAVEAGWNLVGVIDLAQTKQPSTAITGDAYFTSIDWAVAYTYNSSTRAWTRITSSTAANLTNGQGVWVWANKAGTLIP